MSAARIGRLYGRPPTSSAVLARPLQSRLKIIPIPFSVIFGDFWYAAWGFTADESLEERGSGLLLLDGSKIRG